MKKTKLFRKPKTSTRTYRPRQKSARKKGYDNDWQRYRFRFLHYNPDCYRCQAKAEVVDHIKAHKGSQELFRNLTNHMPLCHKCHNYLTGKYDRHALPLTQEKLKDILEYRKQRGIDINIKVLPSYQSRKRR